MNNEKTVKQKEKIKKPAPDITQRNKIPDYEFLFREKGESNRRSKSGILSKLLKMHAWKIMLAQLLYVIKASPLFIIPLLISDIIDVTALKADNFNTHLIIDAVILVAVCAQNIPMHMLYARLVDKLAREVNAGMKSTLISKLQKLSITYHKEMESGKIQSKFLRDLESFDALFSSLIKNILPNIITALIFIGISIYKSGTVTLFFLAAIPLNLIVVRFFKKIMAKNSRNFRQANESLSSSISAMLDMHLITKAHGLEDVQYQSLKNDITRVMTRGLQSDKSIASFGSVVWVIGQLLSGACVIFCAFLAFGDKISVGDIVLYQSMFLSINGYVQSVINSLPQITTGMEAMKSVSEVMHSGEIEKHGDRSVEVRGEILFDNVSFKYNQKEPYIIKNLNLHILPGQCVALVGASGSGKSTILNMIIGFLRAGDGELFIDGVPVSQLNIADYRKNIAVVPQNALLFSGTIRENITYGLASYSDEQLQKVLELANINEFIKTMPKGVDTQVGEHGGLLSGGQRQRITIARALIRDPKILILDEATSALDNVSEKHVQKAIAGSVKGRTTLIVAHRLSTIRNADYIVVMNEGVCVESGTHAELIEKKGLFYDMVTAGEIGKEPAKEI